MDKALDVSLSARRLRVLRSARVVEERNSRSTGKCRVALFRRAFTHGPDGARLVIAVERHTPHLGHFSDERQPSEDRRARYRLIVTSSGSPPKFQDDSDNLSCVLRDARAHVHLSAVPGQAAPLGRRRRLSVYLRPAVTPDFRHARSGRSNRSARSRTSETGRCSSRGRTLPCDSGSAIPPRERR